MLFEINMAIRELNIEALEKAKAQQLQRVPNPIANKPSKMLNFNNKIAEAAEAGKNVANMIYSKL